MARLGSFRGSPRDVPCQQIALSFSIARLKAIAMRMMDFTSDFLFNFWRLVVFPNVPMLTIVFHQILHPF